LYNYLKINNFREEKWGNVLKKTATFLGIFITVVVLGFGYYQLNGMVTEGFFTIEENNMLAESGGYYLFLEEQRIEITEDLFKQLEVNSRYHIKYSWNKLSHDKGKIEELNLDEL
jgi:hypothetical protein